MGMVIDSRAVGVLPKHSLIFKMRNIPIYSIPISGQQCDTELDLKFRHWRGKLNVDNS